MLSLSFTAMGVAPSATLKLNATVAQMKSEGVPVLSLGAGEPDFDTPEHIRQAAIEAMNSGKTRYTDVSGIPQLRQAIADHIFKQKGLRYDAKEVIVGAGAKQVLYHALQAILNPGDEVVLPSPYWVSYTEMIRMAGGVPVFVSTDPANFFLPTPEQMASVITDRTKAMIMNSPNNPTGAVWPRELVAAAMALAKKHDFWVISDEIYEALVYDGMEHVSPASISADAFSRTIVISGFSKSYAMTGWRIGYGSGPRKVIAAMAALQSHATGNVNSIAQYAALAALQGPQDCVQQMKQSFERRRTLMTDCVNRAGLTIGIQPQGAFYLLLDIRSALGRTIDGRVINSDLDFSEALLAHSYVAVVPGSPFGAPNFVRLSYAVSDATIVEAVERIGKFMDALMVTELAS